jgi:hypothetical protein
LKAFEALRDEVDDAVLLRVLERFFDVRIAGDVPDSERVVATYALLLRESARNLAPAVHLGSTRGPVDWWLPILRRHGFRPSLAALHLLEKCERAVDVGDILATAGYDDDEVLRALLDNGVGTRSSLAALRAGGWNLDRMLESLFRRRVLLPEVRAHLEDLGIPRAAQRPVLLRHWPAAIVDLVLHEATTMRRLPSGDSDPEAT